MPSPGFHTSALGEHDLATCGAILRRIGYRAMGVRLGLARLDPLADPAVRAMQMEALDTGARQLRLVIDADGRYLIDPWAADPAGLIGRGGDVPRRIEYLRGAIDLASEVVGAAGVACVTFRTGGVPVGMEVQEALDDLAEAVEDLAGRASAAGVLLCVRPRPGDFVDSVGRFERLLRWVGEEVPLALAADVAAMVAHGEMPVVDLLGRVGARLGCVYLSELRVAAGPGGAGAADGWIGCGAVSAARVVAGLAEAGFAGPVILEPGDAERVDPGLAAALYRQVFGASGGAPGGEGF